MPQWIDLSDQEAIKVISRGVIRWFKGSHYVNVQVRRNGRDEYHEADWLRYVPEVLARVGKHLDTASQRM